MVRVSPMQTGPLQSRSPPRRRTAALLYDESMHTDVSVRLASKRDTAEIAGLMREFRTHLDQRTPSDTEIEEGLTQLVSRRDARLLVATNSEGHCNGYALLRFYWSVWQGGAYAELEDLFVRAEARGHGLGLSLVNFSKSVAKQHACKALVLNSNENNSEALRLYRKAGLTSERMRWSGGRQLFLKANLTGD
jgi:GNAT superfamily N-acetyltransferase